ncbi:MAG: metallophosphoesterase [Terrimicrobiaceae bacterium]|nr:metallophosphoesterase [Terrimicrobiaceae bacterium]
MFEPSADLVARLGADRVAIRLAHERALWRRKRRMGWWSLARPMSVPWVVRAGLRTLGLSKRAYLEYLDVRIVENIVLLHALPQAFDGFRLLQISDLHSDLDPALIDRVIERLGDARFDRCVLTGDYHDQIGLPWDRSLALTLRLAPYLGKAPLAILGNHDFLAKVPALEAGGLRVLLNESTAIEIGGERLWICGVDDPHSFGTHDLRRAGAGIPAAECRILLSHSPETAEEAATLGYALHLSGHTHGGQLCLPGGRIIVRKAPVPTALLAGPWKVGAMCGYTSRGTGGSGVAARLNCPAEITIHILRCA